MEITSSIAIIYRVLWGLAISTSVPDSVASTNMSTSKMPGPLTHGTALKPPRILLLPDASRRQQPPRIASQQANEPDKSGAPSPDLARCYSRRLSPSMKIWKKPRPTMAMQNNIDDFLNKGLLD